MEGVREMGRPKNRQCVGGWKTRGTKHFFDPYVISHHPPFETHIRLHLRNITGVCFTKYKDLNGVLAQKGNKRFETVVSLN